MRRHGALLLILFTTFTTACSTTKPRGQVVRMDLSQEESSQKAHIAESKMPLFEQNDSSDLQVPTKKDDAAIFYFSMGQAHSLDNDPQRAIEAYKATLVYDPNSALVHARLAAELVKLGNYAEAKLLCEKAIQLDPKYVDSYLLLAGIQVAAKEYDAAIATYSNALTVEAKNRDALLYIGVTLAEVGRTKEGIAYLEKLVKIKDASDSNIDQSVAYYYLAKIYDQTGKKDAAIKSLNEAIKHRPGFAKAAISLADLYKEKGNEKKSYEVLEEAFREQHSTEIAERLSEAYLDKSDYKSAVIYLETLVEEDPSNENMRLRLALVYWQLQWLDKARLLLGDLHERYPASSEISFYLGELEMERKEPDYAIVYYKQIAPDYAKYDQMVSRVAFVYREQKKYDAAESFIQEAIKKRPDLVAFYPILAAIYEDQNKTSEAKLALERGKKLFPEDESILYYLGFLYDRTGEKEKGLALMTHLLENNPNNANALNFVGYTMLEKGTDLEQAGKYLERAAALKPNDAFVLDSYGWLLYRQGKTKAAMKTLEKAFALKPEEGVIAEHLADVYVALDMPQKALLTYQKALGSEAADADFKVRVQAKLENVKNVMAGVTAPMQANKSNIEVRNPASSVNP